MQIPAIENLLEAPFLHMLLRPSMSCMMHVILYVRHCLPPLEERRRRNYTDVYINHATPFRGDVCSMSNQSRLQDAITFIKGGLRHHIYKLDLPRHAFFPPQTPRMERVPVMFFLSIKFSVILEHIQHWREWNSIP